MLVTVALELESPALLVQNLDLAAPATHLADGRDRDAVRLGFLLEASGMGGFHGCDDLIIVAGADELGEKLRFFGDRLSGGRRKRHALSLDRGADAGCSAELHRIADEPVGDVDRRAGTLTQRQGKCIARRWAAVAIDEKSALICQQTPFSLEP